MNHLKPTQPGLALRIETLRENRILGGHWRLFPMIRERLWSCTYGATSHSHRLLSS
jgi:hypothetical protein